MVGSSSSQITLDMVNRLRSCISGVEFPHWSLILPLISGYSSFLYSQKGIVKDAKDHEKRVESYGDNKPIIKPPKTIKELVPYILPPDFREFLRRHAANPMLLRRRLPGPGHPNLGPGLGLDVRRFNPDRRSHHHHRHRRQQLHQIAAIPETERHRHPKECQLLSWRRFSEYFCL